jgi:hypothetical protein
MMPEPAADTLSTPHTIVLTVNGRRRSLAWLIANPAAATSVWVENCPGLAAMPDLPAATHVWVENCPGLAAMPDLPAATHVWVVNCPGLAAMPRSKMPAVKDLRVYNCPGRGSDSGVKQDIV